MPYGLEPMKIERFGGLNTLLDATNLPVYASPDCQDVQFAPGSVSTRPGTTSVFAALGGNPTVNYLKSYITPTALLRALVLDSLGNFYKENPIGTLALIGQIESSGVYGNSVSLFGREYVAFGDGKIGTAIPRQFDDTNFDRVSQVGPGLPPNVTDESNSEATLASPNGLIQFANNTISAVGVPGLIESGNLVTVTVTAALPTQLRVGDTIQIAGAGVAAYNGNWIVTSISSTTTFQFVNPQSGLANSGGGSVAYQLVSVITAGAPALTAILTAGQLVTISGAGVANYNSAAGIPWVVREVSSGTTAVIVIGTFGNAASGTATIATAGSIIAGVHFVSVAFVDREGYVTAPAAFGRWTAGGGKRAVVTNIPTGATNIVQRILIFTATGGQSFFYSLGDPSVFSSRMVIGDNTTTTVTVDFSDVILLQGINADALFELVELGESVGVTQYSSRLFWWCERNKINSNGGNGFTNLTFDGGIVSGIAVPGWTLDPVNGTNGFLATGAQAIFGFSWKIAAAIGAPLIHGMITQSAYRDSFGIPIISPSTSYSVRARITQNLGPLTSGVLHIGLYSASLGGIVGTELQVTAAQTPSASGSTPASFPEFIGQLTTSSTLASVPSDLLLRVYADTFSTAAGNFLVDNIEVFPTSIPLNTTLVRASKIEDPESYDGVTGFLNIAENNGQAVRAGFVIRNNLYFVKERSLYATQDDGVNEPNQWTVQEISNKVGTLSVRGAGLGDEWAIIAGLDGVYLFDGSEPQKISQEIQPTWDSINWSLGHLVDVKVDTKRKRVYIAVPLGASATANNRVLTLDYTDGFGDPNPSNTVNIAGIGRKWSPWAIACNSMNLILRSDGTQQLWFGNGTGLVAATGKIYQLDATGTVFNDDGGSVLASDNFNRANENPLVNPPWIPTPPLLPLQLLSNVVSPNNTQSVNEMVSLYDGGIAWPADQYSEAVITAGAFGSGHLAVLVRGTPIVGGITGYLGWVDFSQLPNSGLGPGNSNRIALKDSAGLNRVDGPPGGIQFFAGDTLRIQAIGNRISLLRNGVELLFIIDNTYTSGKPGLGIFRAGAASPSSIAWDNWVGGANGITSINSYWQSGYFQDVGRLTFGPMVANVIGAGACNLILRKGDQGWITNLRSWTLSQLGFRNMERTLNIETERLALRFGTNAIGAHFSLQGAVLYAKAATWAELRGVNA